MHLISTTSITAVTLLYFLWQGLQLAVLPATGKQCQPQLLQQATVSFCIMPFALPTPFLQFPCFNLNLRKVLG